MVPTPPLSADMLRAITDAVAAAMTAQAGGRIPPPNPAIIAIGNQGAAGNVAVAPVAVAPTAERQMKHVMSFRPPIFLGVENPTEAEDWLAKVKRVLIVTRTEEWQKVSIVTFLLEGEARLWWDELELHRFGGRDLAGISLEEFSQVF